MGAGHGILAYRFSSMTTLVAGLPAPDSLLSFALQPSRKALCLPSDPNTDQQRQPHGNDNVTTSCKNTNGTHLAIFGSGYGTLLVG